MFADVFQLVATLLNMKEEGNRYWDLTKKILILNFVCKKYLTFSVKYYGFHLVPESKCYTLPVLIKDERINNFVT